MADLSNNSFIPKRGPAKRRQGPASRQVYAFTLVSYILMFATLLAVGGVYIYGKLIEKQLNEEISLLNNEINSFSEADMQRVTDFDSRLLQAKNRLDNSVSIVSIFEALEKATIDTVQLKDFNLTREGDEKFVLQTSVVTDSFDSTMFQRGVFQRLGTVISSVDISSVQTSESDESGRSLVTFSADLEVPLTAVPYTVQSNVNQTAPTFIPAPTTPAPTSDSETAEGDEAVSNEENI
ncbi:hypothetical protein KC926_00720 [Candidatus Kaiserbacteria bacterium]|nr:hypothetical protein [Candidatus Kaiserbacteria bacterium]